MDDITIVLEHMETQEERIEYTNKVIALSGLTKDEFADQVLNIKVRTLYMKLTPSSPSQLSEDDMNLIIRYAKRIQVYDLYGFKLYSDDILTVWRKVIDFSGLSAYQACSKMQLSKSALYPYYSGTMKRVDPEHMKKLLRFAYDYRLNLVIKYNPDIEAI